MRGTRLWLILGLVTALAAAMIVAGCGDDDDDGGDTGATSTEDLGLIKEGTLSVGVDTPYPPFEIGQPPNMSGFDIQVMDAIADDLELEVEYTATGFGTIFRDTANGQFDTAAAASDITSGRERVVDFTDPYYLSSTGLVVPSGSDIASAEDLAGAIVAVQDGTTQQDYAEAETDAGEVRGFPEAPNAVAALVTGQADALLLDQATAVDAVETEGDLEVVEEIPTDVFFGFAVAPQNDGLREAMNESIAAQKEDGRLDDAYAKYFDGAKAPEEVTSGTNELLTND
jgi:polar amino acid transport system substrate-binding protein